MYYILLAFILCLALYTKCISGHFICTAITCAVLAPLLNGMITYLPTATVPLPFGSAAQYSCNDGFYLQGNNVRTCDGDGSSSDGVWSDSIPVCSGELLLYLVALDLDDIKQFFDCTFVLSNNSFVPQNCLEFRTIF